MITRMPLANAPSPTPPAPAPCPHHLPPAGDHERNLSPAVVRHSMREPGYRLSNVPLGAPLCPDTAATALPHPEKAAAGQKGESRKGYGYAGEDAYFYASSGCGAVVWAPVLNGVVCGGGPGDVRVGGCGEQVSFPLPATPCPGAAAHTAVSAGAAAAAAPALLTAAATASPRWAWPTASTCGRTRASTRGPSGQCTCAACAVCVWCVCVVCATLVVRGDHHRTHATHSHTRALPALRFPAAPAAGG